MGLLNWRRRESGADSSRSAETTAAGDEPGRGDSGASGGEVFRSDSFAPVPEWTRVPPMHLSLPEMPSIMSKRFDRSLVSWQPPARFLGELGHSVSSSAPSGMVEGMAVLVAEAAPQPEPAPPPADASSSTAAGTLPLAAPARGAGEGKGRAPSGVSVRRLPFSFDPPEASMPAEYGAEDAAPVVADTARPVSSQGHSAPAEEAREEPTANIPDAPEVTPTSTDATALPAAPPAAHDIGEPGERTPADLVGSAPLIAPAQPLVAPLLPEPAARPLVQAGTPPDMPLVRLPSAPLAEGEPRPSVRRPPAAVAGLVGDRQMTEGPAVPTPAATAAAPVPAAPVTPSTPAAANEARPAAGTEGADLPLAVPAPPSTPTGPSAQIRRLEPAGDPGAGSGPTPAGPADADPPGAVQAGASPIGRSEAADAGHPAAPQEPAPAGPTAPLVGQAPPPAVIPASPATSGQPAAPPGPGPSLPTGNGPELVVARPAVPPRGGLGEPMTELPPTSSSWDVTRMSRAQQLQASRALIQRRMAAAAQQMPGSGLPLPLPAGPDQAVPPPARPQPGPVLAGMQLPLAPLRPLGPTPAGVVPDDLPPADLEQAPLLGSDPLQAPAPEMMDTGTPPEGQWARTVVGQRYGVDLSHVPVDRSPQGASEAGQLRARAFTSERGVVMPPSVGTLDSGPGEALFAHELTHVAQRARFGPNVPDEDSPSGRAMEAEARATELTLSTGTPLRTPAAPASPDPTSLPGLFANREGAAAPLPLASPAPPDIDADSLAATVMERLSGLTTSSPLTVPGMEAVTQPAAPAPAMAMSAPVQRAAEETTPSQSTASSSTDDAKGRSLGQVLKRPSDEDLSNLSRWLYPLIKYRLKGELREDRERAGLLTDHYRRW